MESPAAGSPLAWPRFTRRAAPIAAVGLTLALAATGCSKSSEGPTQPIFIDQPFADEIAQHVAGTIASDDGGSMLSLTSTVATVPHSVATLAARRARLGRIARDTSFTAAGVAWTIVDTFFTASGTPQDDYDPATSASMHVRALGTGDISTATFHARYRHLGRLQATGLSLAPDTLHLGGAARDSTRSWFAAQFENGVTRRLLCVSDIGYEDVRVVKGQSATDAPIFGIATWTMSVTRFSDLDSTKVDRQMQVTVLIAFDGASGTATMQVGGLFEYTFDLQTGALARL